MATEIVKKEVMNDEIKEFGEDAASAINELLGLYGYNEENKRNELNIKFQQRKNSRVKDLSHSNQRLKTLENDNLVPEKNINYSSASSGKDTSSERENSKSPIVKKPLEDKHENTCSWCHHDINTTANEIIGSPNTVFCSENCFIYWRRASFKRAKTCDFCKNIRNAVSYVDFNDGTTQLQFCSDKCLNQYKMQIFCRETQAHLEQNPHLKDKNESGDSLITPDLWLKNCRTRSPTPDDYEGSKSSSPMTLAEEKFTFRRIVESKHNLPLSTSLTTSCGSNLARTDKVIDVGKPIINVLPSSKLLSRNMLQNKNFRRRRISNRLISNNKLNRMPKDHSSASISDDLRSKIHGQISGNQKPVQPTTFNRPPLQQFVLQPPVNLFKYRLPFSVPPQVSLTSQNQQQPPEDSNVNPPFINPVPPPVVLIPYPIPLPIILPIPLPLTAFIRAYQKKGTTNENHFQTKLNEDTHLDRKRENEIPLDLSSEQSSHEIDRTFPIQTNDDCEEDEVDDLHNIPGSFRRPHNSIIDKEQIYEDAEASRKSNISTDMYERNRPLRKRKIISNQDDEVN